MPSKKNKNKNKHHQQHHQQTQQLQKSQNPHQKQVEEQGLGEEVRLEKSKQEDKKPFRVEHSEIYGRYLVADRDLKPGEWLIKEEPLAIGPCVSADPVCLGCYQPVQLSKLQYRCPGCDWPLCSSKCPGYLQTKGHTKDECQHLKSIRSSPLLIPTSTVVQIKNLYELILINRILMMKELKPETYSKILEMESHIEMRKENVDLWAHYQKNVVEKLRREWKLGDKYSEEEIHTVCGILDVNCFEIGQNKAKARTLYPSAFLLAHNCRANTSHTDDPETYSILLRTSRPVKRNEAITLSYAYTLQGTLKRRDFMHAGKLFWCTCERCSDPTELGTYCSDISCEMCEKGKIRATEPLDQEADWKCDKCDCRLLAKEVTKILDKINYNLEIIDVHDIPGLENFITRYTKTLGPNHYLLLSAKYSLCQLYGKIEGYLLHNMSMEDIKRKENYCREFLKIVDILEPGLTRLRGLIMYELHAPIMIIAQHLVQSGLIYKAEFQKNIKEVIRLLTECRDILKYEPVGSSEHQMGLAADSALREMGIS